MRLDQLTVIVPTKDEADNIGPFLDSLHPDVGLVVVDASADDTREIIRQRRPAAVVIEDSGTIPEARQIGLEAATTDWVLFTDADMSFGDDYWTGWQTLYLGESVGAVQGAKLSADDDFKTYYKLFSLGIRIMSWVNVPAGSGSNMIFRRTALLDAGGFDPALTANEDIYALWSVRKAGWRVPYAGRLKVYERDHRRLEQGRIKKTLHGWIRPLMLFTGLGDDRVRQSSWGYWNDDEPRP